MESEEEIQRKREELKKLMGKDNQKEIDERKRGVEIKQSTRGMALF